MLLEYVHFDGAIQSLMNFQDSTHKLRWLFTKKDLVGICLSIPHHQVGLNIRLHVGCLSIPPYHTFVCVTGRHATETEW